MGLGRYIRKLEGEQFSLLKPNWLTKVFLVGDIVSIALQAVDGGKFVKVDTADNETTVESVVTAGIMVQLVFFTLFIALATSFHFLFLNKSLVQPYGWQKFMVVISVASALILVRSLFRMIEYVEGRDGELQSKEVYIYALDAIPMAIEHAELFSPDKLDWRIVIVKDVRDSDFPNPEYVSLSRLGIAFLAHHVIVDDMSAVTFHSSL
ncbi:RTM1 protein [Fusarium fujikuroi]|nr:RTM1 protein [Fusarium fujikuroi]